MPCFTEENIRAVLSVADHPKGATADPKDFFDNRYIKELEESGFIKEIYGQKRQRWNFEIGSWGIGAVRSNRRPGSGSG